MSVITWQIECDQPGCLHYITIGADQAASLRQARAWYRMAGWRYVPGTRVVIDGWPRRGAARDLCPSHAVDTPPPADPALFDLPPE